MKKVLITGGTGYIGSHTAVEFLNAGYEVFILDNLSNSRIEVLGGIEKITNKKVVFSQLDVTKRSDLAMFFDKYSDFDVIIHFAASKAVGESVEKPLMYYDNNLNSLISILERMTIDGVNNLIFSSSCTVYGQPDKLPVTEQSPIQPATSPYGNTKQVAEQIIRDVVFANKNLKSIALRYFNPIGAHSSALIGELPNGVPNNLIPYITQTLAGIRKELYIFGDNYNTSDGTAVRDYIHVVDLAKAHLVAAERLINGKNKNNFEFFNIGTGKGNSVMEIVKTVEKVTGEKLNYKIAPRRDGDIEQIWADTSVANKELGWKSELTLADALLSAWRWQQNLQKQLT